MSNLNKFVKAKIVGATKGNGVSMKTVEDVLKVAAFNQNASFKVVSDPAGNDLVSEVANSIKKVGGVSLSEDMKDKLRVKVAVNTGELSRAEGLRQIAAIKAGTYNAVNIEDEGYPAVVVGGGDSEVPPGENDGGGELEIPTEG